VLGLLLVVLAAADDIHLELAPRNLQHAEYQVRGCVLRAGQRALQWFGSDDAPVGPAVYLPNAALLEPSQLSVIAAGAHVYAVVHKGDTLLAKLSGTCPGTLGPPPPKARVIDVCKKFRSPPGFFTGVAPHGLYDFGDRKRLDLATAAQLACEGTPATEVTSDLPWQHEDVGFFEGRRKFVDTGVIADTYAAPEMIEALLRDLARVYPSSTRLETIATTHQGRPVYALAVGEDLRDNDPRPTLLLNGGHHGDELLATTVVLDAARRLLEDPQLKDIRRAFVVWCVPIVNPDGLAMFLDVSVRAGRKNGRDADSDGGRGIHDGVDLNRNYPFGWRATATSGPDGDKPLSRTYPGPSAGSEPETQGMMRLAERESFVAALSFHMGTHALLVPYTVSTATDPEPNEAQCVADEIAGTLPVKKQLYAVDGVDQDWHRWKNGTLAYVAEIADWPPPLDVAQRRPIVHQARNLWIRLARRFIRGPSLQTHDVAKAPAQTLKNGEVWLPRQRDGLIARYRIAKLCGAAR
jgi:hypothetical protein